MTSPPSLSPPPVCPLHTSSCVRSTRTRISRQHAHTCFDTFARGAGTHGDVLKVHTGTCGVDTRVFQRVTHHTPYTTPQHKTQHTTTHHNNSTTTPHDNRDRETETDRDRERDRDRQKQREKSGGAWPFFVHGVLCLVKPVNARFLSLLNSVKYDSSLISFSAPWQVNSF